MAMTDWTIISRSLKARTFSTVTTIITVAVAVAMLLILFMMRHSASNAFQRGSGNVHIVVSRDQSAMVSVLNSLFYGGAPKNYLMYPEHERIAKSAPLEYAIPGQLGDTYRGRHPVLATESSFFSQFEPAENTLWKFKAGRAFSAENDFEVVVGSSVARAEGIRLGEKIVLTHGAGAGPNVHVHTEYSFEVVGILEPTGTNHDRALFTNLYSSWILHAHDRVERAAHPPEAGKDGHGHDDNHDHASHGQRLTRADLIPEDYKITTIFLRVATRPGSDVSSSIGPVFAQLRRDPSLTVASPSTEIGRLFEIIGNVDDIFVALAVVVLISSGIGIMLALYNSMEQRRRQIAVLRVLGASKPRIFSLVMTESVIVAVLGAAAGIVLALLSAQVVARIMRDRLGLMIEPAPDARSVVLVLLATLVLGAAAGLIPAFRAYRTAVAENLRPAA
jgi:putative ABC transport system permease protein